MSEHRDPDGRTAEVPTNDRRTNPHARANLVTVTTAALETVLAEAGLRVNPGEFLRMVADAARKISPPQTSPADYFTPSQQRVLGDVGLDLSDYRPDEADPRARPVAAAAVLADSSHSVAAAAALLGVDTSRIRHRLNEGKLIGWKDKSWRLPTWQFTEHGALPGLDVVLRAIPDDQPQLMIAAFMNTRQPDLQINGRPATPREWLLAHGDPRAVAELASTLGTAA